MRLPEWALSWNSSERQSVLRADVESIKHLYHGCTEATARLALTEGLKPRAFHRKSSNWEKMESCPDFVYRGRLRSEARASLPR
jgi:hypothetical protein